MPVSRNMAISLAVVVALLTPLAWYLLAYDYGPVAAPSVSAGGKGEAARFPASGDEVELRAGQRAVSFGGGRHIVSLTVRNNRSEPLALDAGCRLGVEVRRPDGAAVREKSASLGPLAGCGGGAVARLPGRMKGGPPPMCVLYADIGPLLDGLPPGEYRYRLRLDAKGMSLASDYLTLKIELRRPE